MQKKIKMKCAYAAPTYSYMQGNVQTRMLHAALVKSVPHARRELIYRRTSFFFVRAV